MRNYLEVRVAVRNDGATPLTPRARLESNGGASNWASLSVPLAPGAAGEIVVPFGGAPFDLGNGATKPKFTSNSVSAVTIATNNGGGERVLSVTSVTAKMPPALVPRWLGQRPPVAGAWKQTLTEEFDGKALDATLWNMEGENYYDKVSHWSRDEVEVGQGVARLHYRKKRGLQNDDPTPKETAYAAGYLDTYGKWTQRYGYFEARVKLPTAPGLWPAFWMMPDRGARADPRWKRQMTEEGAMEFDIMEHLTGWGPNRNNVAVHYDGYGKDHKSEGSDKIYIAPDKDGFVTYGLLWTPGSAVFYAQGQETARWENPRVSNVPSMLMFTLPSGGWDNVPLEDAKLPDALIVDYVRVWQSADLASRSMAKKRRL